MISWPGNVEHLLHHVHLAADAVEEGRDEVEAGLGDAHEAAEMLDRVTIALVDDLDAHRSRTAAPALRRRSLRWSALFAPGCLSEHDAS
jgi:hypothetical protein